VAAPVSHCGGHRRGPGAARNRLKRVTPRTYPLHEVARLEYKEFTDEALLAQIVEQDRLALECLYQRYSTRVFSLSYRILSDQGASEEVTQDVFLNVWRRAASYKPGRGKFTTWLFGIAHHRTIDELRKRTRGKQLNIENVDDFLNLQSPDILPDVAAVTNSEYATVREALLDLPDAQRTVIEMSYFGGFTQAEIAIRLAQPLGTVKTRMRLGLKKLRAALATKLRAPEL
jgi:RNA polymerase sigma-70 factor (ECF subfamily)|tara:strand:+ start:56 stop:745 length:690 start_codon:yes stop_codon:yes gene_type:complete